MAQGTFNLAEQIEKKTAWLWNWPLWGKRLLFFGLILLVGALDFVTGTDLSFSIFYIVPIFLAAWFIGLLDGLCFSLLASLVWILADHILKFDFHLAPAHYWNGTGTIAIYFLVSALATSLHESLSQAKHLIRIDQLTNVVNRRAFLEAVKTEIARVAHEPAPITVMFLSINHLKDINAQAGIETGDLTLILTAKLIKSAIRGMDTIARFSGDEFAMLLPGGSETTARGIIARLLDQIARESQSLGHPFDVTIGCVTFLKSPRHVQHVIEEGIAALATAKARPERGVFSDVIQ